MFLKAVILDCDGVILDSFREGLRRIRVIAATHEVIFDRKARSRLTDLWGLPGIELLEQGLGIGPMLSRRMYAEWEKYDLVDPVPLIPGAREALYWLRKNGFVSCLLTSRHRKNLLEILDRADLEREFTLITAREDGGPYHKPDPRVFFHTLSTLELDKGIKKEECIFVGDTPSDILAGANAGIRTLVTQTGPYLLKHAQMHPIPLGDILQSIDNLPLWVEENHDGPLTHLYD
ncbi:MAG: HAD family hydrolase [bacterium]|nr:HAD family hydrolase [bacterium]